MELHLTERELIEYNFKLASDIQMKQAAEHLEGCGECRGRLEKLQRKFATLDLLRGETEISEELISRVIEQAKPPARTAIIPFRKPAWISAAAAVLVVGLLLLATHLGRDRTEELEFAKKPASVAEDMSRGTRQEVPAPEPLVDKSAATETTYAVAAKDRKAGAYVPRPAAETAAEEMIAEQPPFAPASAIELVTLPRRDEVQLTIYNSADLTLVRERRNLTLKKGWNWLQFMWANTLIDPTSLSLEPLAEGDKIDIQQLVFPARLRELGRWLIRSEISGQVPFEITYFTSGLSWRAFYMGTLSQDEKSMRLAGYVRVANNSGEDYENAQTRLIVGQVHILDQIAELAHREYAYNSPLLIFQDDKSGLGALNGRVVDYFHDRRDGDVLHLGVDLEGLERKEIKKEGLSEYFLYTIEGTETIQDKWGKRLLSLDVADIEIESLYKYDEERYGGQAVRFVKFANDDEHNLGETPIPNGNVKIYGQADGAGYLSYVGGTSVKYIPVNEEVELNLGAARLVEVEPKLMDFKTENYVFDPNGNITGWDEIRTWQIETTNTRTLPIEIEITRGFGTPYWTLQFQEDGIAYEKHDATHARFELTLEPRSKRAFVYTVTTYHGSREESLTQ